MTDYGRVPVFSEEWGTQTTSTVRDYIAELEAALDNDVEIETLSGVYFCGCSDCYEREAYLMLTKLVVEGVEAGEVTLEAVS